MTAKFSVGADHGQGDRFRSMTTPIDVCHRRTGDALTSGVSLFLSFVLSVGGDFSAGH